MILVKRVAIVTAMVVGPIMATSLVTSPAFAKTRAAAATRYQRSCEGQTTYSPVQLEHGARAIVVGEQTCQDPVTDGSGFVPISVCLQHSKNGVSHWTNEACATLTRGFGLVQKVRTPCFPTYWRTVSIYGSPYFGLNPPGGIQSIQSTPTDAVQLTCK